MLGPVTYDLVSLLRDCYVDNEEEWITEEVSSFQQALEQSKDGIPEMSDEDFLRWFDLTGLQRHLKCIGIFHRLKIRDGKESYLKHVPRVKKYVATVLERYPEELSGLESFTQRLNFSLMKAMILSAGYGKRFTSPDRPNPQAIGSRRGQTSRRSSPRKTCRRGLSGNRDQPWPSWLENSGNTRRRFLLGIEHRLLRRGPRTA